MTLTKRFLHWLFPPSEAWRKLSDKIPVLYADIESCKLNAGADLPNKPWLKIADELFVDLKKALENQDIQKGWKIYKSISRSLIYSLAEQPNQPHLSRAKAIFYEAQSKMEQGSWRQKAILDLLGTPNPTPPGGWTFNAATTTENIIKANEIIDEYQDNFYDKILTLNGHIKLLSGVAIIAISLFIYIAPKVGEFPYTSNIPQSEMEAARRLLGMTPTQDSSKTAGAGNEAMEETEQNNSEDTLPGSNFEVSDTSIVLDSSTTNAGANQPVTGLPESAKKAPSDAGDTKLKKRGKSEKITITKHKEIRHKHKEKPINESPQRLALLVILMGIIGAVVSGFMRIIQVQADNRITGLFFGMTIVTARLVLAMVAALAVYIFLGTGLLLLFSSTISFELLLAFCFIAGFSEQLVKKGVETLTKEEMYKGKKP